MVSIYPAVAARAEPIARLLSLRALMSIPRLYAASSFSLIALRALPNGVFSI